MSIKIHLPRSIIYLGTAAVTLILIIFLYSANRDNGSRSLQKAQRESYRLGTIVRITLYGDDSKKLNNVLDLSMKEIERLENLLSVNIPSSDVSLVNRASGEYPVKGSEEAGSLLERAIDWSERTGGAFDPTVGKIVKLWGIGTESAAVPDPEQLKEAVDMTDFRKVSVLHEVNGTFVQTAKGRRIEMEEKAKGLITEKEKKMILNEE